MYGGAYPAVCGGDGKKIAFAMNKYSGSKGENERPGYYNPEWKGSQWKNNARIYSCHASGSGFWYTGDTRGSSLGGSCLDCGFSQLCPA